MKTMKEQMDKVRVDTYEDCVWYLKDKDKCKLPGVNGAQYSGCYCKDKEMEEFCKWVTKFFKAAPTEGVEGLSESVEGCWEEYNELVFDEELGDVKIEHPWARGFNVFLKKLHIVS